jgi:hypothetical protein
MKCYTFDFLNEGNEKYVVFGFRKGRFKSC